MRKVMFALAIAAGAFLLAPQSASAQCSYRMNDVGRPHGYLSGPCNGAAQGYSGAYPSRGAGARRIQQAYDPHGRPTSTHVTQGNVTTGTGGFTTIRNGNHGRTYDANGRLVNTAV